MYVNGPELYCTYASQDGCCCQTVYYSCISSCSDGIYSTAYKKAENAEKLAKRREEQAEEHKRKIGESNKGKRKGCKVTLETRLKLSEVHKNKFWFNNGLKEILSNTCPEGFVKGRLSR